MKKNTILWAEDDADDRQLMREIFAKYNKDFTIIEVHNGREALDYLEKTGKISQLPCLVILDINMPVLDGKQTLSIIKRTADLKSIPIVVFSTSSSELDKQFCHRMGTTLMTKPPSYKNLELAVIKLLSMAREKQESVKKNESGEKLAEYNIRMTSEESFLQGSPFRH